jgi:hypothetical protein
MSDNTIIARIPKNTRDEVIVSLGEYRGHNLIDIRVFADINGLGAQVATKKGISLHVTMVPAIIKALMDALGEAHRRGLIEKEIAPEAYEDTE